MRLSLSKWFAFKAFFMRADSHAHDASTWASRWVHSSIPLGSTQSRHHERFIFACLGFGAVVLFFVPFMLAFKTVLTPFELALLTFLLVPVALAYFTSRTGKLNLGQTLFLLTAGAFLTGTAIGSGGLNSPLLLTLLVLPLESAFLRGRYGFKFGSLIMGAGLIVVAAHHFGGQPIEPLALFGTVTNAKIGGGVFALVYSLVFAFRIGCFQSDSVKQLVSERDRLRLIANNCTDLVTFHTAQGDTLFSSPAAEGLLGRPAGELLNRGLYEQVHLQDRISYLKTISAAYHGGKHRCEVRLRVHGHADLVWRRVSVSTSSAVCSKTGKTQVIAVTRDVSDLHQVISERDALAENKDEGSKAHRQFISTMSHELRTPLNAIIGFSDILQQGLFGPLPDKRQNEYVKLIHDSGQHLLQVVNEMLDLSRLEAGKYELQPQTFEMGEVVRATIDMLQALAEEGKVSVLCDVPEELPPILADRRACQQILINLLSNAIKFTQPQGSVRLSVQHENRQMRIIMRDTGIGMDEKFLAVVGQPFTQAENGHDRRYQGSGLGLCVVKGLVELHEGTIEFKSRKGHGTTVVVSLPSRPSNARPIPANGQGSMVHLTDTKKSVESKNDSTPSHHQGDTSVRVSA